MAQIMTTREKKILSAIERALEEERKEFREEWKVNPQTISSLSYLSKLAGKRDGLIMARNIIKEVCK